MREEFDVFGTAKKRLQKSFREPLQRISCQNLFQTRWARSSWLRHYATGRKVVVSILKEVTKFFNLPNISSSTIALESTQHLKEMSTRNLPLGKGRPALKADNTAICEPIV
jgi:hypothetical protein